MPVPSWSVAIARVLIATTFLVGALVAPTAAQSGTLTGQVVDANTGEPIFAVAVHAGQQYAMTDQAGHFELSRIEWGTAVHFERMGYLAVALTAGPGPLEVRMQPAPVLLESMVVETDRGEMLASNSALAVTHVDAVDIEASAATSVAESLGRWAGVSVSRVGSWGSRPALRGLSGERLAVMIDGNRVNRACTYGMDQGLATIDPATIERVEIVTGPGSTAFGSGNVGGVINVVTKRPDTTRPLSGEVRANGSTAVPGGGLGGSISVAHDRLAASVSVDGAGYGDYTTPETTVETSGYRQFTGDVKLDYEPGPSHRLSLASQYYGGRDIGWPMRGGAEIPEETRTSASLAYAWQLGDGLVDGLSARGYFQKLDHHMVMSMTMIGMNGLPMTSTTDGRSFSETAGGRLQLSLQPTASADLDLGTEVTHLLAEGTRWTERVMGTMAPTTETFHTWPGVTISDVGFFAQGDSEMSSRLTLSGGVRLDRVERRADVGDSKLEWVTTGNVGLRAGLAPWLTARATVGVGYRTPDPMELYGLGLKPDGFVYRGRSDLKTEKSLSRELALTASAGALIATVTGFTNRIDDMVVPALASDSVSGRPVREYRNIGEASLRGVTGAVQALFPTALEVRADASWTHGEDPRSDLALPMIPPLEGGLALRRLVTGPIRWVEAEWRGAARQDHAATHIGEIETRAWGVVNVRTAISMAGVDATVGVENVFDHMYRAHLDPRNLYRPGRNLFVRMSRAF